MLHGHFSSSSINEEDVFENPSVDRHFVSRDRYHMGSLGLGLRATDSPPGSQTRHHSQTFPFSPEISLDSPSLSDWGPEGNLLLRDGRSHMVASLLPLCFSFSSSLLAAKVLTLQETRLFKLPSHRAVLMSWVVRVLLTRAKSSDWFLTALRHPCHTGSIISSLSLVWLLKLWEFLLGIYFSLCLILWVSI